MKRAIVAGLALALFAFAAPVQAYQQFPCTVVPNPVAYGQTATVSASGFRANKALIVYLYANDSYQTWDGVADANGNYSAQFTSTAAVSGTDGEFFIDQTKPDLVAHCGYLVA